MQHRDSSSSGVTAEQLREKVEAVSKASHVVLLEAMQLRFVQLHQDYCSESVTVHNGITQGVITTQQ